MTASPILVAALVSLAPLPLVIASERDGSRCPPAAASAAKHTLAYIDSTTELIPPTLDGGATEIEMGDVNNDGLIADEGAWPSLRSRFHVLYETSTPSTLTITPVEPLGGETIRAGSTVFIDWISAVPSSDAGRVDLDLSPTGSEGPWQLIAADLPDNGRHQWRVPRDTPSTTDALIRLTLHVTGETVTALTPIGTAPPNQTRSRNADVSRRRIPTDP